MPKKIIIKCPCGTKFVQYKSNHKFCTRKCFLKDYRERKYGPGGFPFFACDGCGYRFQLDYYPYLKINKERWMAMVCPKCGKKRMDIIK